MSARTISNFLNRFVKHDGGLVTVEWVAIAAAVVVGGIVIAYEVLDGMDPTAKAIGTTVGPPSLPTLPTLGNGT